MTLPSYLGICPHCKARVALSTSACAGCGRSLAPGEAEKTAAKEVLYGHKASLESTDEGREGGITGGVILGD